MKFLIVSDTHGLIDEFEILRVKHPDVDGRIHCGDSELTANFLDGYYACIGNNDYNGLPSKVIVPMGKHRALVIHSHRQGYFERQEQLAYLAKSEQCDVVFYGHTHIYSDTIINGVRLINPGSLWHCRDGMGSTYGIFEIDEHDEMHFELFQVKNR